MSRSNITALAVVAVVVGDDTPMLSFDEFCRACRMAPHEISAWVDEGIVEPRSGESGQWQFDGDSLKRALLAARLARELHVGHDDLGLVLDLLDEIARLKGQLRRAGIA